MGVGKYLRANIKILVWDAFYVIEGFGHGAKKEKSCSDSQETFT